MAARGRFGRQPNFTGGQRVPYNADDSSRQSDSPFGRYSGRSSQGRPSQNSPTTFHQSGGQGHSQGQRSNASPGRYHGHQQDRGPRLNEEVCVGEEVKIAVNLAINRFRNDENAKEYEFPPSFTATERAYIHRLVQPMGLKSKSKGKGPNRVLTVCKMGGNQVVKAEAGFQLVRNSRHQIHSLLQRFPLTNKERQELQPRAEKGQFSRELNKTTTGRLNNGVSQVPPKRGDSDLSGFRETLPITSHGDEILRAINTHPIVLVSGETGSGKTTQVPQLILDDSWSKSKPCRIFCTQPRRIAALTVTERVAAERGEKIGQTVGYQIRLESKVSPKTLLTFCTNGVLLRTLMGSDNALSTVTHVIVDEVHERDRFSDFLLIALRELMAKFRGLKVILMSAALNIELFVQYFNNCPVVSIPGNLFDVHEYYLEDVLKWTGYSNRKMQSYMSNLVKVEQQQQQLNEWCSNRPWASESVDMEQERQLDMTAITATGELGQEKEDLEPWMVSQMDSLMSDIWLNGNEDAFYQIFHFVRNDGVSVDYSHSETTATPLMIAAARGFTEVVEQLLNLGANVNTRASNGWTALDWAKKFSQEDVVELLQAYIAAGEEGDLEGVADDAQMECTSQLSQQDKDLLAVYHGCFDDDRVDIALVTALVSKIHTTQPEGAILIFLPGYDDIVSLRESINEDKRFEHTRYIVFVLHSAMQSSDQRRVFRTAPPGVRKIILATNIAETSITINDVVYVVNSGKVKEKTFDALTSAVMLKSCWISKASAKQRKGRAGRCRPGVCYNMFSSVRYQNMADYQLPELMRYPLQELCLHTKLLTAPNVSVADFISKAPEAPGSLVIRNAVQLLKQMDAFDACEDLTELGLHLTDLPLEPQLGKMVLYSVVLKCLDPVLTIACALAYKDPFLLPSQPYQKRGAVAARKRFAAGTFSDHMTYLRSFQAWQKARADGWERSFCEKHFLSSATFEMIVGMRTQLLGQLRASGFVRARGGGDIRDLNTNSENWAVVKAALCSGSYPNLLRVDRDRNVLVTQKKDKVRIHNTSVLSPSSSESLFAGGTTQVKVLRSMPSDWLVYEEMSHGQRLACVRCCSLVSPITVALFAGPAKLPSDTLRDAESGQQNGAADLPDNGSDSESEDKEDGKKASLKLDDWVAFKLDPEAMHLTLNLRQKWQALFFRRMRTPAKPWSQIDEAVLRAVINVLTTEEQAMGLQQPVGIGQRPRPMAAESLNSAGGRGSYDYEEYNSYYDNRGNNRMRKSPATTPRRSPKYFSRVLTDDKPDMKSGGGNKQGGSNPGSGNNSASNSQRGSASSTPCPSPGPASPSQQWDKDPGVNSPYPCRFFIMKCNSQKNLEISANKGVWSTSVANEKKITKAFKDGKTVYLIFSIQGSGHFQGYAKISHVVGRDKPSDFNSSGNFGIEWIKRSNVPFQATHHILNPWNENRKVQVSRDGQELEPNAGEALLKIWERFPQQGKSSQAQGGRHMGAGDGPISGQKSNSGVKPGSYPGNKPQYSGHFTGQSGDHRHTAGSADYPQSSMGNTVTPAPTHNTQVFSSPETTHPSGMSPRFVTPVMSQPSSSTRGTAQLTILQRGCHQGQGQARGFAQEQQQHQPQPGSYPNPSPGAYQPPQNRQQYRHN